MILMLNEWGCQILGVKLEGVRVTRVGIGWRDPTASGAKTKRVVAVGAEFQLLTCVVPWLLKLRTQPHNARLHGQQKKARLKRVGRNSTKGGGGRRHAEVAELRQPMETII